MEVHNNNCQQFFGTDIDGMVIINGNVIRAVKELSVENDKVFIISFCFVSVRSFTSVAYMIINH